MTDRVGAVVEPETAREPLGRLEELYVRHVPTALRTAYLVTGDADLAQDLAHDAFLRAAGRFRHLRDPGSFDAYLRRAVVNLATSHHRHRKVERAYVDRQVRDEERMDPPDIGARDELRSVLRTLPVRQRAAVVLRYYEDLSEAQVAETLGCSVPAARSLVARAMKTLRHDIRGDDR